MACCSRRILVSVKTSCILIFTHRRFVWVQKHVILLCNVHIWSDLYLRLDLFLIFYAFETPFNWLWLLYDKIAKWQAENSFFFWRLIAICKRREYLLPPLPEHILLRTRMEIVSASQIDWSTRRDEFICKSHSTWRIAFAVISSRTYQHQVSRLKLLFTVSKSLIISHIWLMIPLYVNLPGCQALFLLYFHNKLCSSTRATNSQKQSRIWTLSLLQFINRILAKFSNSSINWSTLISSSKIGVWRTIHIENFLSFF